MPPLPLLCGGTFADHKLLMSPLDRWGNRGPQLACHSPRATPLGRWPSIQIPVVLLYPELRELTRPQNWACFQGFRVP